MTTSEYKYDVAFSFLADDEDIATSINDLIKDGLTTFIYSEKQKELAGTDGEKTFNLVFGSEARIVFVLYRKGWGETSWTRIEETAIRNRGYDEGYDFVVFAPLDKNPELPKWLPKNRIWIGLNRWGIEGAASVIEARVQEAGGIPKEETIEDRVNRLRNEIDAEKDKNQFLDSSDGVKFANDEVSKLFGILEQAINNTNNSTTSVSLNISVGGKECAFYGDGFSIRLKWFVSYTNSLRDSVLHMDLFDGSIPLRGESSFPFNAPKRIKNMEFQFDVSKSRKSIWKESRSPKQSYSSEGLSCSTFRDVGSQRALWRYPSHLQILFIILQNLIHQYLKKDSGQAPIEARTSHGASRNDNKISHPWSLPPRYLSQLTNRR